MGDLVRVLFSCTGVGIFNRGIETFFREAFDGLKGAEGIEARLIKGAADRPSSGLRPPSPEGRREPEKDEQVVWCLPRTGTVARLIGKLTGRSAYAVEQWSSFLGVVREIRRFRPHVVFTSDANLMFLLRRFRRLIGVPFRVLYSNGGPVHPPFNRHDFVQQVAPLYRDEALAAGEPPEKHFLVPYGIHVPSAPVTDPAEKLALRRHLGLPLDRQVILSVGWIARQHKRMDYVIEEVARLPQPRPFLQLLGAIDENSSEVIELGNRLLGPQNFAAHSVPYEEVADYYKAADVFVLGSLAEGFGRVYLESLMHGLPTIGHKHPVIEYVLGDAGMLADLSVSGNLAAVLADTLQDRTFFTDEARRRRRESVRSRFDWSVLRPQYAGMFRACARTPIPFPVAQNESASGIDPGMNSSSEPATDIIARQPGMPVGDPLYNPNIRP
jgi:1,2-diacylglycerol 3-alpha-glucosyltransferase